jgi:DNA repair protein RadD
MIYTLRDYQTRLLNLSRKAITEGHKSILLQGETGMGKSVVFTEIIRSAYEKGSTILFLVHRSRIFDQVRAYMDRMNIPYGIVKGGEKHEDWHQVQLAMVQSAHRRLDKSYVSLQPADIIIIDECHTSASESYLKVIQRLQKNILIGLTATPVRKNGYGLKKAGYSILFQGADYGGSRTDLIKSGALVPNRYYAPVEPDLSGVPVQGGDYNLKILESRMLNGTLIDDVVGWWFKFGENRPTFLFAVGIKHSIAKCDEFMRAGVAAEHVDGDTPKEEQDAILERFESGITKVICSCDLYIEGVDLKKISCVVIARSTKSIRIYHQMVGRGSREDKANGKKDNIVIDVSGSFAEHGAVEEFGRWRLEDNIRNCNTTNAARKERNSIPIDCPICRRVYTGQLKCPDCGNIPTKAQYGRDDIAYINGTLGEICLTTKKAKVKEPDMAMKRDWYSQIKNYGWSKGKDQKWIDGIFRSKFLVWPNGLQNLPIKETSPEVANYIKHRQIRFAKGKQKSIAIP